MQAPVQRAGNSERRASPSRIANHRPFSGLSGAKHCRHGNGQSSCWNAVHKMGSGNLEIQDGDEDMGPHVVPPETLVPMGIYGNSLVCDTHKRKRVHLLATEM